MTKPLPIALGLVLLLARPALAELQEVDLLAPGDALVTRDTATGLDWLDIPLTAGLSYDDVRSGVGGWIQSGWRFAREDEICRLFHDHQDARFAAAGCAPQYESSATPPQPVFEMLGATLLEENPATEEIEIYTAAHFDDGEASDGVGSTVLGFYAIGWGAIPFYLESWASISRNAHDSGYRSELRGALLVQDGDPPHLAWIGSPEPGENVGRLAPIHGTALGDSYTLEFRPDGAVGWSLAASGGAVVGDVLGVLDLSDTPPGPVAVRLSVVQDGELALDEQTLTLAAAAVPAASARASAGMAVLLAALGRWALHRRRTRIDLG